MLALLSSLFFAIVPSTPTAGNKASICRPTHVRRINKIRFEREKSPSERGFIAIAIIRSIITESKYQ